MNGEFQNKTLHWLEFLGGWPGALIAQRVIRHKNKKTSFQVDFMGYCHYPHSNLD